MYVRCPGQYRRKLLKKVFELETFKNRNELFDYPFLKHLK